MKNIPSEYLPEPSPELEPLSPGAVPFAAAYLDHAHVYGQTSFLKKAGAELRYVYDPNPVKVKTFCEAHPEAQPVNDFRRILDDPAIRLVTAAAIPNRRSEIGCEVMRAGKDYFTDKCPFTTLEQLEETRRAVKETGHRYWVSYGELICSEASWHAGELIRRGVIGNLVSMVIFGPHRLSAKSRPDWFFRKEQYGGILTDIASHQVAAFLDYAGTTKGRVLHARVANLANPEYPELEDFGQATFSVGERGISCYSQVDWFTPDGLKVFGDGRTFVTGTKGTIELRKYVDVARGSGGRLFLVTDTGEWEIPCAGQVYLPFHDLMLRDILYKTDRAMPQEKTFAIAELSMQAQKMADEAR